MQTNCTKQWITWQKRLEQSSIVAPDHRFKHNSRLFENVFVQSSI